MEPFEEPAPDPAPRGPVPDIAHFEVSVPLRGGDQIRVVEEVHLVGDSGRVLELPERHHTEDQVVIVGLGVRVAVALGLHRDQHVVTSGRRARGRRRRCFPR